MVRSRINLRCIGRVKDIKYSDYLYPHLFSILRKEPLPCDAYRMQFTLTSNKHRNTVYVVVLLLLFMGWRSTLNWIAQLCMLG